MKKYQSKTAQLTLGAILLAVFLVLHLIIPGGQKMVQGFLMILTFLPLTIYSLCCGVKKTLIMAAAGACLSALLLPLEVTLSFAIPALLLGLVCGMIYGKRNRMTVILILAGMHFLQNVVELFVYYLIMEVDFVETYRWAVDLVYQKIPQQWLTNALFSSFLADMMVCGVPCLAILGAGAKGIFSYFFLRILHSRLTSVMGPEPDNEVFERNQFAGKGLSIAYFCGICLCAIIVALPVLSIMPYHFICAGAAAMGLLIAVLYAYYFYINRIRTLKEHKSRLIYSFLMMALLPITIFALPWLEMHLLKKEQADA